MIQAKNPNICNHNNLSPDLIIIGAGIFGLWAARHAIKRGQNVLVLEKRKIGAGASGGFLGALMPYLPDRWEPKKQRQFDALVALPEAIEQLEADTGHDCGFKRCGRLMPLTHEKMERHVIERVEGAKKFWQSKFDFQKIVEPFEADSIANNWLSSSAAPFGVTFDNFSARVNPRAYVEALGAYVRDHGTLMENTEVRSISNSKTSVTLTDGTEIFAEKILVANGYEAYDLLGSINAQVCRKNGPELISGRGVKGQAVLVAYDHGDELPILFDNGCYVVPHQHNLVAIGSTSINQWKLEGKDPDLIARSFDPNDMGFYERALELCPSLKSAPIVERWANIRPRNTMIDPETGKVGAEQVCEPIAENSNIMVAIGGFKVSFGVAHLDYFSAC